MQKHLRFGNFKILLSLIFLVFLGSSQVVQARGYSGGGSSGFKFNPNFMYLYDSQTGTSGSGINTSRILGDARLGYQFDNSPFFLGGIYTYDSRANTGNSSAKDTYTGYGATVGVMTENIFMLFSYYLSSQYDQVNSSGTSTTTYTSGSGFEVALGYLFMVGSNIHLGPELAYRSLQYTQVKNPNGSTGTASLTATTLVPYIAIFFSL